MAERIRQPDSDTSHPKAARYLGGAVVNRRDTDEMCWIIGTPSSSHDIPEPVDPDLIRYVDSSEFEEDVAEIIRSSN